MPKIKKEDVFYTMLKEFATEIDKAADEYVNVIEGYPQTVAHIPQLKLYENRCDDMVARIMKQLYASFITPFDREDISDLSMALDDIMDEMNGVVLRLDLFNAKDMRVEGPQMAELARAATHEMREMFERFSNYKDDPVVMEKAIQVSHIEDEGDRVYHDAIRRLFHGDEDGKTTLAWLRLFDRMENVLNACDHVCVIVRSVVLKSA